MPDARLPTASATALPAPVPPGGGAGALVWLRRDLRLHDHRPLAAALAGGGPVWCAFIFDTTILEPLRSQGIRADRRVEFIHHSLAEVDAGLRSRGGGLIVRHGDPREWIPTLARQLGVATVHLGRDYEPAAVARDAAVSAALAAHGIAQQAHKDMVVLDTDEVLTAAGRPFSVFTPYRNAWLRRLTPGDLAPATPALGPEGEPDPQLAPLPPALDTGLPPLEALGFAATGQAARLHPGAAGGAALLADFLHRIDRYADARDFPAVKGPSYLSTHLRFGTVSIRQLAREAHARAEAGSRGAEVWRSELVWRDFYHQVLHHHPRVVEAAFRPEYDAIAWETGPAADALYAAWCEGRTGYPLVDAAMAQLNQTGYLHNRLRMVVASFLTKDLGLDWRRGEAWFARQLNDFDLAANNGGWQWAASSGCDAQPYFRIFNPVSQSERFDAEGRFIRRYLPQLAGLGAGAIHAPWLARPLELEAAGVVLGRDYPRPVVDHAEARARTLARYAVVKVGKAGDATV